MRGDVGVSGLRGAKKTELGRGGSQPLQPNIPKIDPHRPGGVDLQRENATTRGQLTVLIHDLKTKSPAAAEPATNEDKRDESAAKRRKRPCVRQRLRGGANIRMVEA